MIFPRFFAKSGANAPPKSGADAPSKPGADAPSRDIGHGELQQALQEGGVRVVDVREPHEFAAGHIPGAVNLPLSRFRADELPQDKPPVLICQAGGRSAKALHQAVAAGVANVRHYPGGMSGWRTRGGQVSS